MLMLIICNEDYFTRKFQELRKPKTNIQVLQQSSLLKYSKLLLFVQMEAPSIGEVSIYICIIYIYSFTLEY